MADQEFPHRTRLHEWVRKHRRLLASAMLRDRVLGDGDVLDERNRELEARIDGTKTGRMPGHLTRRMSGKGSFRKCETAALGDGDEER